jgi:hypothetical protein
MLNTYTQIYIQIVFAVHTHLLVGLKSSIAISDLKGKYNWQEGFGAFSYSGSQIDTVIKFILNQ